MEAEEELCSLHSFIIACIIIISYSFIIAGILLQGGCTHLVSANTFNWEGCCTLGAPMGAGHLAPKALPPSLLQESNSGKSRSNGNKRPKKSPWAMT